MQNNIKKIITIACLSHLFVGGMVTTRGIFISSISEFYHLKLIDLGYLYTSFNIGLFISISLTGSLCKICHPKILFISSLLFSIFSFIMLNIFHAIYCYALFMFIIGLGCGIILTLGSYFMLSAIKNSDHNAAKLVLTDLFFISSGFLSLIFSYLLSHNVMWFFLYNIFLPICMMMLYFINKINYGFLISNETKTSYKLCSNNKISIYLITVSSFFYLLFDSILSLWLINFLQWQFNVTIIQSSLVLTSYCFAKGLGLFINQFNILRWGLRRYLFISSFLSMIILCMLIQTLAYPIIIILLLLLGFITSGIYGSLVSYACSQVNQVNPKTVSFIYATGTVGTLISSGLSSYVVSYSGILAVIKLVILIYFLYFILINSVILIHRYIEKLEKCGFNLEKISIMKLLFHNRNY